MGYPTYFNKKENFTPFRTGECIRNSKAVFPVLAEPNPPQPAFTKFLFVIFYLVQQVKIEKLRKLRLILEFHCVKASRWRFEIGELRCYRYNIGWCAVYWLRSRYLVWFRLNHEHTWLTMRNARRKPQSNEATTSASIRILAGSWREINPLRDAPQIVLLQDTVHAIWMCSGLVRPAEPHVRVISRQGS